MKKRVPPALFSRKSLSCAQTNGLLASRRSLTVRSYISEHKNNFMAYELPPLPYPKEALEPFIDAQTMEIHHDRHHKAYVDNLNKALESAPELADLPVDRLIANLSAV